MLLMLPWCILLKRMRAKVLVLHCVENVTVTTEAHDYTPIGTTRYSVFGLKCCYPKDWDPRCFTDLQVALFWIKSTDKDWKPFARNRVEEIRKLTSAKSWSHCSVKDNPVDLPSRGLTPTELATNWLLKSGPDWLRNPKPLCVVPSVEIPEPCLAELRASSRVEFHSLLTSQPTCRTSNIIDIEYSAPFTSYSTWLPMSSSLLSSWCESVRPLRLP